MLAQSFKTHLELLCIYPCTHFLCITHFIFIFTATTLTALDSFITYCWTFKSFPNNDTGSSEAQNTFPYFTDQIVINSSKVAYLSNILNLFLYNNKEVS